jgi:asparagine synthase (glutamine-hydrolysing)
MGYDSFRVVPSSSQFARFARPLRHMRGAANLLAQHLPPIPRYGRVADALLSGGSLPAVWLARRGLFSASEIRDVLDEAAFTVAREVDPIARVEALDMPKGLSRERQVSVCELSGYMHDQLLRDTDAMSMAHSLEVRVPLIGLPVVEAVGRTATEVLLGDRPKSVLRSVLAQHLPHELMAQRKKGFVLDWSSLLRLRRDPSDPTLEGLLQPHAFPQERARLAGRAAGYARLFSLHALAGARQRSSDAHARSLPLSAE